MGRAVTDRPFLLGPGVSAVRAFKDLHNKKKVMTVDSSFLITFGLHHFVSHSVSNGENHFIVDGSESQTMISHAKKIIGEMFGAPAVISVR